MKYHLIYLTIIILLIFTSCGRDDAPTIVNEIQFGDNTYATAHGFIFDGGVLSDTHYNYDFYISDGILILDEGVLKIDAAATYYIYASLASRGKEGFQTGEFIFSSTSSLVEKNIFLSPQLVTNPAGFIELAQGTGGTITVSGTSPNYTITYDLILGDKLLTGSFTGVFDIN